MSVAALPPWPDWQPRKEYVMALAFVPHINISSRIANRFGEFAHSFIFRAIVSGYTAKVLHEVAMTPNTYMVVNLLKLREGADVVDAHTKFNPFALSRHRRCDTFLRSP